MGNDAPVVEGARGVELHEAGMAVTNVSRHKRPFLGFLRGTGQYSYV